MSEKKPLLADWARQEVKKTRVNMLEKEKKNVFDQISEHVRQGRYEDYVVLNHHTFQKEIADWLTEEGFTVGLGFREMKDSRHGLLVCWKEISKQHVF